MKGRVLLVHVFFDVLGGAEFLALNAAKALREDGYSVTILSSTPLERATVLERFNIDVTEFNVAVKQPPVAYKLGSVMHGRLSRLRRLTVYKRFFTEYISKVSGDYDLVLETQSNIPSPTDISYIHYPAWTDFLKEKGKSPHWRLYDWIVKLYASTLKNEITPGRVLTNSSWTAAQIFKVHHIVADIVYPPVDVEYFSRVYSNENREKLIVTTSRFVAGKMLHKVVDVAAKLRDYTFVLIGSTTEHSQKILESIERKIKEQGLNNVIVETNLPRSRVLKYLETARFYLHPEFPEHFGISIVEAMAAGAVPIVYRDGGAWHDVVSRVSDVLGYGSIEEVPGIVKRLESSTDYLELRRKSMEVSRMFTYENFKRNLLDKVEYVLRVKRLASSSKP